MRVLYINLTSPPIQMQPSRLTYMLCNLIVLITSIYLGMTVYEAVDSAITVDAKGHPTKHFRGDRNELRSTLYSKIEFFMQDLYEEYSDNDEDKDHEKDNDVENAVYSPFKVCYVNSYRVYDSNSTTFDYTKETEYDVQGFVNPEYANEFFGLNKIYMVFDDIHMVFSIKNQQCIQYPDIYHRL